jgi:predicted outer membrane repeat protein
LELGELKNNTHYFAQADILVEHTLSSTLSRENTFTNNYVAYAGKDGFGGAVYVVTCNFTLSGVVSFTSNRAQGGGAAYILNTTMYIAETVNIVNNTANVTGGGFAIGKSTMVAKGQLNFIATQAGGMISLTSTSTLVSANLINNTTTEFGGAILSRGDIISCHNITITGNTVSAISLLTRQVNFNGDTNMCRNSGRVGGAITARVSTITFAGSMRFEGNSAFASGGAINGGYKATYLFSGNTVFINNRAKYHGGAIHEFIKVEIVFSGVSLFKNNSVDVSAENDSTMEGQ